MKIKGILEFSSHAAVMDGRAHPKGGAADDLHRHPGQFGKNVFHN
jgi:hypothetical protein